MSSKPRPAVPPKPARLSVSSQKRDSASSATSFASSVTSPLSKIPLCASPPPTSPEPPFSDDRTPRASEVFPPPPEGRQARALYDFEGESSFHELSFRAGDVLNVLKERLSDGWSLAEKDGITGLVPEAYITYTTEFTELPNSTLSGTLSSLSDRDSINSAERSPAKSDSMSESMCSSTYDSTNGSIRRSKIIGKRQLNRFSWFVTTGVEEFLLSGGQPEASISMISENGEEVTESDKHFIQSGPNWQAKAPSFEIMVHNPEKRVILGVQEYTIFHVTSVFSGVQVTVERRYSQFEWLYKRLVSKFGCFVLPPLPEKQYSGRFNEEFIEKRRRALEVFINRLARHPVIRYSDLLTHFLNCNDDSEWRKREKDFESDKLVGRVFFQNVYHSEFNVDDGDVETMERFTAHARAMEKLMPWINDASQAHKDSLEEMQRQYRQVSYALLRLITGKNTGEGYECVNEEGAWCWRDGCNACLSLTKALQSTAESMQAIADIYDSYTKETVIPWIENYKGYSQPATDYEPLIDMHAGTYRKYKEVSDENLSLEQSEDLHIETIRSRCETVFNVTLAEVNRIHEERVQDFQRSTKQYLDGQIEFHEKVLEELRQARANFDEPHYSALAQTPRNPSSYEALVDEQRPILSRPVSSVGSMSDVVGGVVGSMGNMGNFLKKTARTSIGSSMFESWWGGI